MTPELLRTNLLKRKVNITPPTIQPHTTQPLYPPIIQPPTMRPPFPSPISHLTTTPQPSQPSSGTPYHHIRTDTTIPLLTALPKLLSPANGKPLL